MKNYKICFLLAAAMLVGSGCATRQTLYQWGGYDAMLYQSYKNADGALEFRQKLETHLQWLEQTQKKVAPGLYAELGTLYLQAGDKPKAVAFYTKERDTWPESRGLMDSLIKNVDAPRTVKAEAKS